MIFFSFPENEVLTTSLSIKSNAEMGDFKIHRFPDGETLVKINTDVKDKKVIVVCSLNNPDTKIIPLYFFVKTAKELGAKEVLLVAPYLAYMRQDKRFNEGEGVTSGYFASLLSSFVDGLITIDPHLHRIQQLSQIYTIPTKTLHAENLIVDWIKNNISNPILIGPDSESEQWVSNTAISINAPYIILQKNRKGDKDVEVSVPEVKKYRQCTPVLVDDIISTAKTMIETVNRLKTEKMKAPVCIGIHAVFGGNAYQNLLNAGVEKIITCNTITHPSNKIDVVDLIAVAIK